MQIDVRLAPSDDCDEQNLAALVIRFGPENLVPQVNPTLALT